MTCYCDTSFFIRQYLNGPFRSEALKHATHIEERDGFLPITLFTKVEVIQGLRFQAWLNANDKNKGYPVIQVDTALNLFLAQFGTVSRLITVDWISTFARAELLTRSTLENGWRTIDIIHVAAAVEFGAKQFYSFDRDQNSLASAQGMETPLFAKG